MPELPKLPDIEKSVLGGLLNDNSAIIDVIDILDEDCFTNELNRKLFNLIKRYFNESSPIDTFIVFERLKNEVDYKQLAFFINEISSSAVNKTAIKKHSLILVEKRIQRDLIKLSQQISKEAQNPDDILELLSRTEQRIFDISLKTQIKKEISIIESVNQVMTDLEQIKSGKEVGLIKTGLMDLDNLIGGLKNSELTILGARPSMGKSSLALRIIKNVSDHIPVLLFSLEMSHKSITTKLLSLESGMSYFKIATCKINQQEQIRLGQAGIETNKLKLFIDDSPSLNIFEIKSKSKRLKLKEKIGFIVVDYLQLIRAKADTREREIALISSELKSLAKELDIPILCLSQLNRSLEQRSDKRPTLADLRESGSIEQDADLVLFLYRDEYYGIDTDEHGNSTKGISEVSVAKNRNGAIGKIKLLFKHDTTDFVSFIEQNQIDTYYNDII